MPKNGELTDKDKQFCRNYVVSENATASYLDAFAVTYDAANSGGSRLLASDSIQAYIQELRELDEADRKIQVNKLREENLEAIRTNLTLGKLLKDICISKANESKQIINTDKGEVTIYKLTEPWLNAIARAAEASSRLDKAAREGLILLSGLEKVAEEIINGQRQN